MLVAIKDDSADTNFAGYAEFTMAIVIVYTFFASRFLRGIVARVFGIIRFQLR